MREVIIPVKLKETLAELVTHDLPQEEKVGLKNDWPFFVPDAVINETIQ